LCNSIPGGTVYEEDHSESAPKTIPRWRVDLKLLMGKQSETSHSRGDHPRAREKGKCIQKTEDVTLLTKDESDVDCTEEESCEVAGK